MAQMQVDLTEYERRLLDTFKVDKRLDSKAEAVKVLIVETLGPRYAHIVDLEKEEDTEGN